MLQHRCVRLQRDVDGGNPVLLCIRWRCVYEQYYQAKPQRNKAFCVFHHRSKDLLIRCGGKKITAKSVKTLCAYALARNAISERADFVPHPTSGVGGLFALLDT